MSTETVPPSHPPTPCIVYTAIVHIGSYRIDVNFNFIMHPKPGFSTSKIQQSSPSWEGDNPSHTLPLILNTFNMQNRFSHPLYCHYYTFSAIIDVNINSIMHKNLNLVLGFPKSPHPPSWCPIHYLTTEKVLPPPPPYTAIIINIGSYRIDVDLNLITHQKPGFSTPNPKRPHRGILPPPHPPLGVQYIT